MKKFNNRNNKNTNNIDIENVEKILIKNLENKKDKHNSNPVENSLAKEFKIEDYCIEAIDFYKNYLEDNPILNHFERKFDKDAIDKINSLKSNKYQLYYHSDKAFNEKIGEYVFSYFDITMTNMGKNESNKKNIKAKDRLCNLIQYFKQK